MEHIYIGLLCFVAVMLYATSAIATAKNRKTALQEILNLENEAREERIEKFRLAKIDVGFLNKLVTKAGQAGLNIGEVEIFLIGLLSATGAFLFLGTLFSTMYVGMVGIPIGIFMPVSYLNGKIKKRGEMLANQLHGCLIMWSNGIRSGLSLEQSIITSIDRVAPEINEELKKIKFDLDLGQSAADALEKALKRIPVAEFKMVVMTARIHKQLGGNLAERFDNIAVTIEDRVATRANLKAYTTQARLGATVAGAMPFVVLAILKVMSPDYLKPMTESPYGVFILMTAVLLVFMGWYLIKKIGDISLN